METPSAKSGLDNYIRYIEGPAGTNRIALWSICAILFIAPVSEGLSGCI